jgi:hypothetical protein
MEMQKAVMTHIPKTGVGYSIAKIMGIIVKKNHNRGKNAPGENHDLCMVRRVRAVIRSNISGKIKALFIWQP